MSPTLSYSGDCRDCLLADGGQVMGPNQLDELVQVVSAEYDPATDVTTATFRYVPRDLETWVVFDRDQLMRLAAEGVRST